MLKILHVASFSGNVGDNINHAGSYRMLKRHLSEQFAITEWEIREYFWRTTSFDDFFAARCNEHDFVLFGGGNYFELWVERSVSGTSVDIPLDVLEKIRVPIIFHSLGLDAAQGYTETSLQKTRRYFETLLARKATFISLRNDGSLRTAKMLLGSAISQHIHCFPDGGFFAGGPAGIAAIPSKPIIGINIAGDMLSRRFGADPNATQNFFSELVKFIDLTAATHPDMRFRFFPHIFRDVHPIAEILERLPDPVRRRRVEVAPLLVGRESVDHLLQQYAECSLVLGNRFHANVCPVGLGVPTLGLVNYPQVQFLYEELELTDRCIDVAVAHMGESLHQQVSASLSALPELRERYRRISYSVFQAGNQAYAALSDWLNAHL